MFWIISLPQAAITMGYILMKDCLPEKAAQSYKSMTILMTVWLRHALYYSDNLLLADYLAI